MTAYSTTAKRATTAIPAPIALAPHLPPAPRALKVSRRSQLPPFLALEVLRTASELQAAGQDIVHLEIGQPSTSAPQQVNDALVASLSAKATHGYTLAFGVPVLRERIARLHRWGVEGLQDWVCRDQLELSRWSPALSLVLRSFV